MLSFEVNLFSQTGNQKRKYVILFIEVTKEYLSKNKNKLAQSIFLRNMYILIGGTDVFPVFQNQH